MLNIVNSAFAFLVTFLIIKNISVTLLGEFYLLSAIVSIILLIQVILPPTFTCLRIQDKKGLFDLVVSFYIYIQIPIIILASLYCILYFSEQGTVSLFFIAYCCALGMTNLFDVLFQAKARLDIYLTIQILISISKCTILYFISNSDWTIKELLICYTFIQWFFILVMFFIVYNIYNKSFKVVAFKKLRIFMLASIPIVKGYYLNSVLKKLYDNSVALILAPFVSKEVLGIFVLYQKCLVFGVSFLRTLESLLLNRQFVKKSPMKIILFVSPICQVMIFTVGYLYFYLTVGVSIWHLFAISFLVYPISITISLRARLLRRFKTRPLNLSMVISLISFMIFSVILHTDNINFALGAYSFLLVNNAMVLYLIMSYYNTDKIDDFT